MKRSPFWLAVLLVFSTVFFGCDNSPQDSIAPPTPIIHNATSEGLSRAFEAGKDASGITLKISLDNGKRFQSIRVGDDVSSWFEDSLDRNVKATIIEIASGPVTTKAPEENPTSLVIGFEGTPSIVEDPISVTIPQEFLYNHEQPIGVVIKGHEYQVLLYYPDAKEPLVRKVKAGNTITKPTTAQLGYKIDNWVIRVMKDEFSFDFATPITKNMTLWGKPNEFMVTFTYYDGTSTRRYVYEEQTITAPTNTDREEYVFDGWYLGETKFDFATKINKDITLEGKWNPNKYQVTFTYYPGKAHKVVEVESGKLVPRPPDTARAGFKFDGWYVKDGELFTSPERTEFDFDTPIKEDMTITGVWIDANAKVSLRWYAGGKLVETTTSPKGEPVERHAAPANSFKESVADSFKHWTADPTQKDEFAFTRKVYEDMDFHAVWNELNIGDIYVVKEYLGNEPKGVKTDGVELYIVAKRNYRDQTYRLPSDYPYKYLAVDNNHDLSYYIVGTDHKDSDGWTAGVGAVLVPWGARSDVDTGGTGAALGDGFYNTQKALSKQNSLFSRGDGTVWDWLLTFRERISEGNRGYWLVPSHEELGWVKHRNNASTSGLCSYWSSTETTLNQYSWTHAETAKYVHVDMFYDNRTYTEIKTNENRVRLFRVL